MRRLVRDLAMLAIGLAGIYHEVAVADYGRPILVGLFAAMIGVAAFLRAGAQRRRLGLNEDDVSMNPFDR